jgi:hypothetical protein
MTARPRMHRPGDPLAAADHPEARARLRGPGLVRVEHRAARRAHGGAAAPLARPGGRAHPAHDGRPRRAQRPRGRERAAAGRGGEPRDRRPVAGGARGLRGVRAVRAARGRFSALRVSHRKSVVYGAFVWACGVLSSPKRRFPALRAAACLVHYLLSQKVTSPHFTILNGPGAGARTTGSSRGTSTSARTRAPSDTVRARPGAEALSVSHSKPFFVRRFCMGAQPQGDFNTAKNGDFRPGRAGAAAAEGLGLRDCFPECPPTFGAVDARTGAGREYAYIPYVPNQCGVPSVCTGR